MPGHWVTGTQAANRVGGQGYTRPSPMAQRVWEWILGSVQSVGGEVGVSF